MQLQPSPAGSIVQAQSKREFSPPAMLTPHDSASAFLASEVALETASEELRRRIYSGEAARAEEYLDAHSELALDAEQALDLIYVEYAARRAVGARSS